MGSTPRRISVRLPIADASRLERLEAGLGRPASAVIRLGLAHLDGDATPPGKYRLSCVHDSKLLPTP